jgi:hypothetical protein
MGYRAGALGIPLGIVGPYSRHYNRPLALDSDRGSLGLVMKPG